MKINNIYEDYSGERLYSVLLDDGELALFSKAKEETKEKSRGLKGSLIGAGIGAGAGYGVSKLKNRKRNED